MGFEITRPSSTEAGGSSAAAAIKNEYCKPIGVFYGTEEIPFAINPNKGNNKSIPIKTH